MSNTAKLLLLLAAVLQQPGCVASRAPHEPYRPPIIEPLLFQPEAGTIYTAANTGAAMIDAVTASVEVE